MVGSDGPGVAARKSVDPSLLGVSGPSEPQSFQRFQRVRAVVEGHDGILEFLVGFVSLAREKNNVAGLSLTQDIPDSPATFQLDRAAVTANGLVARLDLGGDRSRVFFARVVAGNQSEI